MHFYSQFFFPAWRFLFPSFFFSSLRCTISSRQLHLVVLGLFMIHVVLPPVAFAFLRHEYAYSMRKGNCMYSIYTCVLDSTINEFISIHHSVSVGFCKTTFDNHFIVLVEYDRRKGKKQLSRTRFKRDS